MSNIMKQLQADKAAISQTASGYLHEIERLRAQNTNYGVSISQMQDEAKALKAEIERLRAALKECADDLESELNGHYQGTLDYPSQQRRFERDMAPITAARKLLAGG